MSRFRQRPGAAGRAWPITALAKEYPRGCHVPPHRHRRGQLLYASSGVMQVTTREGIWIVPPQRSLWIPLGMSHEILMEGPVAVRMLYLDRATSGPFGPHCRVMAVSPLLRELILAAVQAHGERDTTTMQLATPLLLHALRNAEEAPFRIPVPSDPRLRKACQRLLDDASRPDTLEQLASRVGASSRTLARLFDSELRMSFVRWRQHVRLARAISQMSLGRPVKSVARDAGYASTSAFCSMFHRIIGVSPTDYLRQVDGKPAL